MSSGIDGAAVAAALAINASVGTSTAAGDPYADPVKGGLPRIDVDLDLSNIALVVTDRQVDFFEPYGRDLAGRW